MRVSVILPFCDADATLPESLASIFWQTLRDFELIAIDDGSSDSSAAILRAAADPRLRLIQPGRIGLVAALNLGLAQARASLIARMDADDVMAEDRLELQAEFLDRNPHVDLVGCRVELFSDEKILAGYREYVRWQNSCVTPEEIDANLYVESPFSHPSVMFRKEVVERLGRYRDGPFPEDYELWLRMAGAGRRMAKLPQTLLRWRERPDRASRKDPRYSREAFDRLRADYLSRDPRLHTGRPVVIWGAGRKTRQRVRLLVDRGVRPVAYVDIDPKKIGRTLDGLPVHGPEWLRRAERPFVLVYVTSHGARELIASELIRFGYQLATDFLAVG